MGYLLFVKQNPPHLTPLPLRHRAAPIFLNRLRLTPPGTPGRGLFSAVTEKAAGLAGSHDSCSLKKESQSRSKEKKTRKGLTVHISMLAYVSNRGRNRDLHSGGKSLRSRKNTHISQVLPFSLPPVCEATPPKCTPHVVVAEFGKTETIFTGLAGPLAGSWHSGIFLPGIPFLTSSSPPKLCCEFPEVGITTVRTISVHLAELNEFGINKWLCIY